jgi:hypothetical protein
MICPSALISDEFSAFRGAPAKMALSSRSNVYNIYRIRVLGTVSVSNLGSTLEKSCLTNGGTEETAT